MDKAAQAATQHPDDKTGKLNMLHAWRPVGLVPVALFLIFGSVGRTQPGGLTS